MAGIALMLSFCTGTEARKKTSPMADNGFVVVELFTSEGCSSCPPADEAMIKLAKEFPQHVYFLGYHVDYWDYIGWKDEFDNPEFTKRQNKYAEIFRLESIYTPQAIINGESELVGSKESQLRSLIQDKLKQTTSSEIQINAGKGEGEKLVVSYKTPSSSEHILNIALVQSKASTNVKRGENNGRLLNHMNIVRDFKSVSIAKSGTGTIELTLPRGLDVRDLKLIAFIQNEKDMKILGATVAGIQ